jgi:CRP-like cAMP-binding protein
VVPLIPPLDFARPRRFRRGELLIQVDAPADTVYLLRHGQVRVFVLSPDGDEQVIAVLGPGHLVGIGALLGRPRHHAFVQALSTVDALMLPAAELQAELSTDRALLGLVVGALAQRLALEQALLRNAVLLSGSERLRDIAMRLPCAGVGLTVTTLAGLLGLRPETLSRLRHGFAADHDVPASAEVGPARAPSPWLPGGRAVRTLPPGARLLPADPECILLIRSGRVRLSVTGSHQRELYVATLGPGDLLNLASTLGTPPFDLRASAETTTVIEGLPCDEFLRLVERDPAMAHLIARRLITRVIALDKRSARARSAPTTQLLWLRLSELSAHDSAEAGEQWLEIRGRWTHAALAHEIGRTRESVTRALAGLEAAGYVRRQGRRVFVHGGRLTRDLGLPDEGR